MQRVGTDRGIGKSETLKLIIEKKLLENVTGMKFCEYGFVPQDLFCYRKRENPHTFVMVHWTPMSVTLCQLCWLSDSTEGQPRSLVNSIHQNFINAQWKQKCGVVGLGFSSPNSGVSLKRKGRELC